MFIETFASYLVMMTVFVVFALTSPFILSTPLLDWLDDKFNSQFIAILGASLHAIIWCAFWLTIFKMF